MFCKHLSLFALAGCVLAHGNHDQTPIEGPHKGLWYNTLPGDGGTQVRTDYKTGFRVLTIDRPTQSSPESLHLADCHTSPVLRVTKRNMTLHS